MYIPKLTRWRSLGGKFIKPSLNTSISKERIRERWDMYFPPLDSPLLLFIIRPLIA